MKGAAVAQTFNGQRKMLDELARIGHAPTIGEIADNVGCAHPTARNCALWLEREGFVTIDRAGPARVRIHLLINPSDDELRAAIAGRRAAS